MLLRIEASVEPAHAQPSGPKLRSILQTAEPCALRRQTAYLGLSVFPSRPVQWLEEGLARPWQTGRASSKSFRGLGFRGLGFWGLGELRLPGFGILNQPCFDRQQGSSAQQQSARLCLSSTLFSARKLRSHSIAKCAFRRKRDATTRYAHPHTASRPAWLHGEAATAAVLELYRRSLRCLRQGSLPLTSRPSMAWTSGGGSPRAPSDFNAIGFRVTG